MTGAPGPSSPRRPSRTARALLALYPRRWRQRYGAELEALLRDAPASSPRLLADLARGALDARLHPELAYEPGVPQAAARRLVGTMLMAAMTVALVVAGFVKLSEDLAFRGSGLAGGVTRAGLVIAAGGGAAVLARPLVASLRWSLAERRPEVWLRLVEVPVAAGLWLLSGFVLGQAAGSIHGELLARLVFLAWCAFSCALLWEAARAAGTALALTRVELPLPGLGRGLWAVAAGALVALAGIVLWGLLALTRGDFAVPELAGLPLGLVWLGLLLVMSTAIAVLWRTAQASRLAAASSAP